MINTLLVTLALSTSPVAQAPIELPVINPVNKAELSQTFDQELKSQIKEIAVQVELSAELPQLAYRKENSPLLRNIRTTLVGDDE